MNEQTNKQLLFQGGTAVGMKEPPSFLGAPAPFLPCQLHPPDPVPFSPLSQMLAWNEGLRHGSFSKEIKASVYLRLFFPPQWLGTGNVMLIDLQINRLSLCLIISAAVSHPTLSLSFLCSF